MNIAILCYHRIGGSGIVAFETGYHLAKDKNHNIHFVGLEPPFRYSQKKLDNMFFHKICVEHYPVFNHLPYTISLASQLADIVKQYKIDIIHSHYALPHAVAAILTRDMCDRPIKCITTLHGTDVTIVGANPTLFNITKHCLLKSDKVTTVSNHLKSEAERIFELPKNIITTIYNFINPEIFYPPPEVNSNGKIIFIHLSNMRKVKRPLDAVAIFDLFKKKSKLDCELWLVGDGPLMSEINKTVDKLKLNDSVKILGIRNDIANILRDGDILLLPSEQESFGLAALEAMACGTIPVACDTGGLPEVITDNKTGFLFPLGDIETATTKILNIVGTKQFQVMKNICVESAITNFNINNLIEQYEKLFMG